MTTSPHHAGTAAALSAPANFRDLGGGAAPDGRIRTGVLFRSDDLSTTTPEFARAMVERHGIAHVVDLRSADEAVFTGRGPLAAAPVTYHHIPVADGLAPGSRLPPRTAEDLGAAYADFAERAAERWALAVSLISAADAGGVVFHCAAGKDRTGILAALLLSALGAGTADIAADYARTEQAIPAVNERIAALISAVHQKNAPELTPQENLIFLRAPAETMAAFLAILKRRHGDVLAPLRRAGLSAEAERRLRERMLQG